MRYTHFPRSPLMMGNETSATQRWLEDIILVAPTNLKAAYQPAAIKHVFPNLKVDLAPRCCFSRIPRAKTVEPRSMWRFTVNVNHAFCPAGHATKLLRSSLHVPASYVIEYINHWSHLSSLEIIHHLRLTKSPPFTIQSDLQKPWPGQRRTRN